MIIALIGPSAAGKSSLARRLAAAGDARVVPTVTTRPIRPDEVAGSVDHQFCDDVEYDAMLAAGCFVGTGQLPGLRYRYGLPALDRRATRPQLVLARADHVAGLKRLGQPTVVYHLEAGADLCQLRLAARDLNPTEADVRAGMRVADLTHGRQLADRIFHNDAGLDDLAEVVSAALHTDRKELTR